MLHEYGVVLVFLVTGAFFVLMAYLTAWIFGPGGFLQKLKNQSKVFAEPYECGVETYGPSWFRFNISFYLYALLFVIFDIETVFLYPWAVVFRKLGLYGFIEMSLFIMILLVGLAYAWKKGALRWE